MPRSSTSFKKGQVGNPFGRPKAIVDVQLLARTQTKENIITIQRWRDQDDDPAVSLRAAQLLHEIAWGKPMQSLQHSGPDNGPIICKWQE